MSLNVKTTEGLRVADAPWLATLWGWKDVLKLQDGDYTEGQANQLLTQTCTNQTTSWLVHSWSIFSAQMSHEQTWTHKTHHGPNLGEATTFPFIIFYVFHHRANTQLSFVLRLLSWSPEIFKIATPTTMEAHIFFFRPLIKMKSKTKL